MKSTLTETKGSVVEGEVTLSSEEFGEYWNPAYDVALQNVSIPGFRKGSAPRELAAKAIDHDAVFHHAADRAVRASLSELGEDNNWRVIDGPSVEVLEASPKKDKQESAFKYRARFIIFPRIELGNYQKIATRVLREKKAAEVSEEEVRRSLEWLRGSRAELTEITRGALKGDVIEADIESFLGVEPIPGGKLLHDRFLLGESRFVPGFDDALIGKCVKETAEFTLTAPADYWEPQLRGKEVRFMVVIQNIFERKLPDLTDAFVASLGPQLKTVDDLRKNIQEGLRQEKEDRERDRLHAKMLDEIGRATQVDIPDIMIARTLDGLAEETARLTARPETDKDKLKEALKEKAEARVRGYLVIHAIAEKEGLEPTEEEIQTEIGRSYVDPKTARDYSYGIVRNRKVFEFLEKQ
jgi:trigger factor